MNSAHWLAYFQQNRLERWEPDWELPVSSPLALTHKVAKSLSHFQLGESGEGSFLLAKARRSYSEDPDYCAALNLFIKEEQEHARLLARLVRRFEGRLVTRHWPHSLFRLRRRTLGATFTCSAGTWQHPSWHKCATFCCGMRRGMWSFTAIASQRISAHGCRWKGRCGPFSFK